MRSSASNKQVPDSSGSNEKRFLKGRSPAFFRHKRLRVRYGYTGPSRGFGDNSFPAPPPESPGELSRTLAPPNVNILFLTSSYIVLLY